jgi:hypothetical protein
MKPKQSCMNTFSNQLSDYASTEEVAALNYPDDGMPCVEEGAAGADHAGWKLDGGAPEACSQRRARVLPERAAPRSPGHGGGNREIDSEPVGDLPGLRDRRRAAEQPSA